MVKHIILWKLKETLSEDEKALVKQNIKTHLEGLVGLIPGLLQVHVQCNGLSSSTADVMLDSAFESADALKNYAADPRHVAVADTYVRPFTATRSCLDFEV